MSSGQRLVIVICLAGFVLTALNLWWIRHDDDHRSDELASRRRIRAELARHERTGESERWLR